MRQEQYQYHHHNRSHNHTTTIIIKRQQHRRGPQPTYRRWSRLASSSIGSNNSQQEEFVGTIETKLLDKYRTYDYERKVNRQKGDHHCLNQRKGGENADFGQGPYFVYVVWQFNPGALELAMRRAR